MIKSNLDIQILATAKLPTPWGTFQFSIWKSSKENKEHILLARGDIRQSLSSVLIRIHSACITGESFVSLKCDCREQLQEAMRLIGQESVGAIIYLNQEGRGIGLVNKIKAYALQDNGLDTVQANQKLHLPVDKRNYQTAVSLLKYLGITKVKLMTNNPKKVHALTKAGIHVTERIPMRIKPNEINKEYLLTKKHKLGHIFEL
ncbi:GTP cyclohydrolase II [Candidatus Gottesmanbacteria bacterium]|nr:GTP cyclohydrolase II [Candidatus Gottesmanbacteria bacterium]